MKHLSLAGEWLYDANWGRGMAELPAVLDGSFAGKPGEPLREKIRFSRIVSLPRRYAKRRAFFYLEQTGACFLRINSQDVGRTIRRYLPWEIDITSFLHPGDNEFLLELDSAQNPDGCNGCGKIELLLLPKTCIRSIQVREGMVSVLPYGLSCGNVTVEIGNKSFYRSFVQEGWTDIPFETKRLKRWRTDFPRMYRMNCILTTPDWKEIKEERRVGLRSLSVRENRFRLDESPFYLIARQMDHPPAGVPAGEEWWNARFQLEKAHGVNLLFCSGWCPPESAFSAADQAGIFLAILPPGAEQYGGNENLCREEARELPFRYGSHPSFAMAPADGADERFLPISPIWEKEDLLLQTPGGALRFGVIHAPEEPSGWKKTIEAALLRRDCAGILLQTSKFPDEYPAAKGFSGLFYHSKKKPTLRQWREFCSDMVLLLEKNEQAASCGGVFSARIFVRNNRKGLEHCTFCWRAGDASGSVSVPIPLGLHEIGQITFPFPKTEGTLALSAWLEENDCQNSWILSSSPAAKE